MSVNISTNMAIYHKSYKAGRGLNYDDALYKSTFYLLAYLLNDACSAAWFETTYVVLRINAHYIYDNSEKLHLSASAMVIHYEEALYQVYAPFLHHFARMLSLATHYKAVCVCVCVHTTKRHFPFSSSRSTSTSSLLIYRPTSLFTIEMVYITTTK